MATKVKTIDDYIKQYESSTKEMPLDCYIAYEYLKDTGFNNTITMETMNVIDHEEPRLHAAIINGLYDLIYVYKLAKKEA